MAIVDPQGRLFGRLNLLDAAFVLLLFALIPLGYASWIVFRSPPAQLTSVEPGTLMAEPSIRLVVHGANLRPFMRVSLGTRQGLDFLFRDSTRAEAVFTNMEPGVYDLILYDFEKERSRLPQAVTITKAPVPAALMIVVGSLGNLKPDQVQQVKVGMKIEGLGEVTAVGRPQPQSTRVYSGANTVEVRDPSAQQVPVSVRMGCNVRSREGHPVCAVGEIDLRPGLLLMTATQFGLLPFQVDQMLSSAPLESVRTTVRFQADPRMLTQMRKGDVNLARATNELAAGATLLEVSAPRPDIREASMALQSQHDQEGWVFNNQPLRVGAPFSLRTPAYELSGIVLSIEPDKSK
jgi:hypothetical protein